MTKPPEVTAVTVTWNSRDVIAHALQALRTSIGVRLSIVVVDNASSDGTVPLIRESFPDVSLLTQRTNSGFAQGNNEAIRRVSTPWVLLCNPDVVVDPQCVAALIAATEHSSTIGSAGPLLYRAERMTPPLPRTTIDSTGFSIRRRRSVEDRDAGRSPNEVASQPEAVFGVTAACALYRRSALEDIAVDGNVFDPDFGSYKEDVDLAWRLQGRGWDALFVPSAVAWHRRGVRAAPEGRMLSTRNARSRQERMMSYRNHLYTLWKNESWRGLFHPRVLWYEWRKTLYAAFFEPYTLLALPAILWKLPRLLGHRRTIRRRCRRQPRDLAQWFT